MSTAFSLGRAKGYAYNGCPGGYYVLCETKCFGCVRLMRQHTVIGAVGG